MFKITFVERATERRGDPCGRPISANVPIYRGAQVRQDSETRWRRRTPSELIHIRRVAVPTNKEERGSDVPMN
jgi:hypothetical protein